MTAKIIKFPINQYQHLLADEAAYWEERAARTVALTGFLASKEGYSQSEALTMQIAEYARRGVKDFCEQKFRIQIEAGFNLHRDRPGLTMEEAFHLSMGRYRELVQQNRKTNA